MLVSFLLMVSFFGYSQEGKYYSEDKSIDGKTNVSTIFVSGGTIIYGKENILNAKIYIEKKLKNRPHKTLVFKKKTVKAYTEKFVQKKTYPREKSQVIMVNRDAETQFRVAISTKIITTIVINNYQIGLVGIYKNFSKIIFFQKPNFRLYDDGKNENVTHKNFSIRPPPNYWNA